MTRALWLLSLGVASAAFAGAGPVPITAAISVDAKTGEAIPGEGAYPARFVADDDPKTTWVANGRRLLLGFPAAKVVAVELMPGYGKSPALWAANRRVLGLKYRFYPKPGDGQSNAPPSEWKTIAVPAPERFTTAADAIVPLEIASNGEAVALEIEVTEATKKTKSDDICVSLVRVQASGAPTCPRDDHWRYLGEVYGTTHEVGDRLEADFDDIDLGACSARHEGTGGGTKTFKGTCKKVKGGVRFEGTTSLFDGVGEEAPERYSKTLEVRRFGCGLAEIGGHLYTR